MMTTPKLILTGLLAITPLLMLVGCEETGMNGNNADMSTSTKTSTSSSTSVSTSAKADFKSGQPLGNSALQALSQQALDLNQKILDVDADIQNAKASSDAKAKARADQLEAEKQALKNQRQEVVDSIEMRKDALDKQGKVLEDNLKATMTILKGGSVSADTNATVDLD